MPPTHRRARKRGVGIVRVSEVGDRSGESFISPVEQRSKLTAWAAAENVDLVDIFEELNVSAGLPLRKRPGVKKAVQMIEDGAIDLIVFAYFDRSFRNVIVQMSTLERIWEAGGTTHSVDYGEIRIDTAASWFSTLVQGAANELQRRSTGEKVRNAHKNAVARGVAPFSRVVRGYRRTDDGRIALESSEAPFVTEAFAMRADGMPLRACHRYLTDNGVKLTHLALRSLFESRMPLGELHAGKNVRKDNHPAIVDRLTWDRVQRQQEPRGRPPLRPGTRLLAQQGGLLRCSGCNTAMSCNATKVDGRQYAAYQCGRKPDCPRPVGVSARLVDQIVADECRQWIADRSQSASYDAEVREAEDEVERTRALFDSAVEAFDGQDDLVSVQQKIKALRRDYDAALDRLTRLRASGGPVETISGGRDWDRLSFDAQRALVRAVFRAIVVAPAAGPGGTLDSVRARLTFHPFSE